MLSSLLVLALVPQGPGSPTPVVINEFAYDDSGTDDREYVELYNASKDPVDIGDWVLDSDDPFGSNADHTIPAGTILAPGDFWVMGAATVPNVDQIVGTTNLWENTNESLTLRDSTGAIVDTLVYEANVGVWDPALAEGEGVWGNLASIDGVETAWARLRDGLDTDNNGRDFRLAPWTPGTSNNLPDLLPMAADYDAALPGDVVADWGASFKPPHVIDPTVVDAFNPNAIPASPAGGNAAVFWDETGGGNANMLVTDASDRIKLDAWVYFDAAPEGAGFREMWTVGVQGTTASFYNHPDPSGLLGFTANGNTGVGWTFEVLETGATLYLVDDNDGGTDHTVLGQIAITPGTNDGWQRLALEVTASSVTGRFGGTPGFNDGTAISAPIAGAQGGIYVGYREFVLDQPTVRPFTVDGLRISTACSNLTVTGDGAPGTSLAFDLTGGGANALAFLAIGPSAGPTTINFGPLGTLELGLDQFFVPFFMGFTDGNGDESLTLSVPGNAHPQFDVFAQAVTLDISLGHGRPSFEFCTSDVEGFRFGSDN